MSSLDNGEHLGNKTSLGGGRGGGEAVAQLYTQPFYSSILNSALAIILLRS
jgi:hypothetical protein